MAQDDLSQAHRLVALLHAGVSPEQTIPHAKQLSASEVTQASRLSVAQQISPAAQATR
jgi:hypothetical protein